MPIADWSDMMPHTVTYEAVATRDEYGKPATYATAVEYAARVRHSQQRVANRTGGQDVISSVQIWIAGALTSMSADDRVTLPDGSTPVVITWDVTPDEAGDHHTKIYCGAA